MNWGFLILCCLCFAGICLEFSKQGDAKKGTHNGWTTLVAAAIQVCITLWAMRWQL